MASETDTAESTRLDKIESEQERQGSALERIEHALARLVPTGSQPDAQQRTEERLDRPSSVEEQVRAELAKRDRQAAEQSAADEAKTERESIREQLAKLQEKPPAPPVSRATRLMWGEVR